MTIKVSTQKQDFTLQAEKGERLLSVLIANDLFVQSDCGGKGTCGKCKVRVLSGGFENVLLDADGKIFACRAIICEDSEIEIDVKDNRFTLNANKTDKKIANHKFGIALDLGTTTLAASLIDITNNEILSRITQLNNQSIFGADVISRIDACVKGNLSLLQNLIIQQLNSIINHFKSIYGLNDIQDVVVAGNTTMLHIFCGTNPQSIGVAPYEPVFTCQKNIKGQELGVDCIQAIILPSVSGYIGSDITAGMLSSNMESDGILIVDLGTNGEIAYSHKGKIYCASTAVGPAFEGSCIECGIGGVSGAISKFEIFDGEQKFQTVDNACPTGICGAGLVDIVATLVKENIVEFTGAFDDQSQSPLSSNLVDDKFYITEKIYLSSKDIRQFQLAKSAICSGIQTLFAEIQEDISNINTVCLAGGIGYYIDKLNAISAGVLPKELGEKIISVGNSSLAGAEQCLLDENNFKKIVEFSEKSEIVELTNNSTFSQNYMMNISFGEGF